jgi:hypothetical protein
LVVEVVDPPFAFDTVRVEVTVPFGPFAVNRYVWDLPSQAKGTDALPFAG